MNETQKFQLHVMEMYDPREEEMGLARKLKTRECGSADQLL